MRQQRLGRLVIIGVALLNVVLWLATLPLPALDSLYALYFTAEIFASTAVVLIATALVLVARPAFLEPYFGGLDRMYQAHKQFAMTAFLLLVAHFLLIPDSEVTALSKSLGVLAMVGILILLLITIAPRVPVVSRLLHLPYHRWRIAHKFLGLFFIVGVVHHLTAGPISARTAPGLYMMAFALVGVAAYAYKQLFARWLEPYRPHVVERVQHLNGTCVEVTLRPTGQPINYRAGQFAFVYFADDPNLREPHPFTVSSAPHEETLRLTIKGSGDWTRHLLRHLKAGARAAVHGGFGMFNYKHGGRQQVWLAGGIGVTPFLSWLRDLNGRPAIDVDFFWGVHSEEDAVFLSEFQTTAQAHDNFRLHVRYAVREGNWSADEIAHYAGGDLVDRHIYMCGPIGMMEALTAQFRRMGVPADQIHYEEFNFR
jgi:predicted ferric reductase